MYDIRLSGPAEKDLAKLAAPVYRQVLSHLHELREWGPAHPGLQRLSGQYRGQMRLRVGEWRIRLRHVPEKEQLVVLRLLHRSRLYRR